MEAKTFEIRDKATFVPVLAVRLNPNTKQDRYLLSRAGFGREGGEQGRFIMLIRLTGGRHTADYDVHSWGDRTMQTAHRFMEKEWATLESGAVIDVEYILGEATAIKISESEGRYFPLD